MTWSTAIPLSAIDETGTTWQILHAWPYRTPGDFTLEVRAPGREGVRGARLRGGQFELIPLDDPRLPALRAEAEHGVIVRYKPYKRAVIRAERHHIKVYRPGSATLPAERCAQMDILLDAGNFITPTVLPLKSQDVIVFSTIPGPTLKEVGADSTADEGLFLRAWKKWSWAWVAQLTGPHGAAQQAVLDSLPLHSAEVEAADASRRLNRWMLNNPDVPELSSRRRTMLMWAERVAANLLRTPPDPLVWAHGDLYDKQIIAAPTATPLGLLDFDGTSLAEAAQDLANLDVHLELHLRQGQLTPSRYEAAHRHVLATAEELHVSPGRFQAYSDALWFRLASSPLSDSSSLGLAVLAGRAERHRTFPSATTTERA